MLNTNNKTQMNSIAEAMQGLHMLEGMNVLALILDVPKQGMGLTHKLAKAKDNVIIFGTGIETDYPFPGIEAIFFSARIALTKEEKEFFSNEWDIPENLVASKLAEEFTENGCACCLDSYFDEFENVERTFSILTKDGSTYPQSPKDNKHIWNFS